MCKRSGARFSGHICDSPAYVYDVEAILHAVATLRSALGGSSTQILYSVKSCAATAVLELLCARAEVDGFSVASPSEAELLSSIAPVDRFVHLTTPGIRAAWLNDLRGVTHLAFNSIEQWERLCKGVGPSVSCGLRINPGCSVANDLRYDPGRRYSKLGVAMAKLQGRVLDQQPRRPSGFHVHNACLSRSWAPLFATVSAIVDGLGPVLSQMEWINLGGGYIWDNSTDSKPLRDAVEVLEDRYGLQVFLEPGAGIVNAAGYLVASVIDLFESDGKTIAVLDTTVNHLPEVFEYQYEPDVLEHVDGSPHEYVLAGCSCLAGDLFGEYSFEQPLEIGSRITFANVGAYSLAKAHMFNGIDLPSIYLLAEGGELELMRRFTYEDFLDRCGAPPVAVV